MPPCNCLDSKEKKKINAPWGIAAQHTYLKGYLEAAAPGSSFGSDTLFGTDMVFWLEH